MIFKNIEFFNIEQIVKINDNTFMPLRFPQEVINKLGTGKNKKGVMYGNRIVGSELRFKTDSLFFDLLLTSYKDSTNVYIFFGDYMYEKYTLQEGVMTNIQVKFPDRYLDNIDKYKRRSFDPRVIRVVFSAPGYVYFHSLNTFGGSLEKPSKEDCPQKTLLYYGSSISQGVRALDYVNTTAFLLSNFLNCNVLNKSLSGACHAEESVCEVFKHLEFDKMFFEFGVNVVSCFNEEKFRHNLFNMLNNIKQPIYLTGIYKNYHYLLEEGNLEKVNLFNDIIKNIKMDHVTILDPSTILDDFSYLSHDLLHPSDIGQLNIALNLKDIIKL